MCLLYGYRFYDTSDYPPDHPAYSVHNKKKIGIMKDEMCSIPIKQFVALKAKMYSVLCPDERKNKKVAKGVSKVVVDQEITHDTYLNVLQNPLLRTTATSYTIQSDHHVLYTRKIRKSALSAEDSKRVMLNDGIHTLPFGHCNLNNRQWCRLNVRQPNVNHHHLPLAIPV